MPRRLLLAALLLTLAACASRGTPSPTGIPEPLPVMREFRAAWIATVANIDWPSRPGLSPDAQKEELRAMLDRAVLLKMNGIVLQVRPAADALYDSPFEPWSEYLTGEMGRRPDPFYDPLAFAVSEAHARGLELHAWFNPFRARHAQARGTIAADHVSRARPELVRRYGRSLWMDPGDPEVQDISMQVIRDVVRRYDVDGVHIDDYFYPYAERDSAGVEIPFPDSATYARYRAGGGRLARDDWRRNNVDRFVERMFREVRREKSWVKVGISPFGIWRPGHPPQIRGFDPYERLYADSRKWLREGWLDYFVPQLYWPIARTELSFSVLLRWWAEQNVHDRHLWPGAFTSRALRAEAAPWPATEIVAQVNASRGHPGSSGLVHFSMKALMQNPDSLVEKLGVAYARPALVPASPWMGGRAPGAPRLTLAADSAGAPLLRFTPSDGRSPMWWVVRVRRGREWTEAILPGWRAEHPAGPGAAVDEARVQGVDRLGALGRAGVWRRDR